MTGRAFLVKNVCNPLEKHGLLSDHLNFYYKSSFNSSPFARETQTHIDETFSSDDAIHQMVVGFLVLGREIEIARVRGNIKRVFFQTIKIKVHRASSLLR